jgi:hypothetical protein
LSVEEIERLNLLDKIIYFDMKISESFMKLFSLDFNGEDSIVEILNHNQEMGNLINDHDLFFEDLFKCIKIIIESKDYRVKFDYGWGVEFSTITYFVIIIRSLHYIHHVSALDESEGGMLHRSVVERNINGNIMGLKFLFKEVKFKDLIFKVMMLLSTSQIHTQKIIRKQKKKFKTDFYLKFNFVSTASFSDRIKISYSRVPFKFIYNYSVGASHLTLIKLFKKSNYQQEINHFHISPLRKRSNEMIKIKKYK